MSTFTARYPGRCGDCDSDIRPGDEVTYVDDELVHASCPAQALAEATRPACPRCFTVPAVNGECGCS